MRKRDWLYLVLYFAGYLGLMGLLFHLHPAAGIFFGIIPSFFLGLVLFDYWLGLMGNDDPRIKKFAVRCPICRHIELFKKAWVQKSVATMTRAQIARTGEFKCTKCGNLLVYAYLAHPFVRKTLRKAEVLHQDNEQALQMVKELEDLR